jgi:uncharacterized protein (TIGR03382 family)
VGKVDLRVKAQADTTVELHAESNTGTLLGKCQVSGTSNAWATQSCTLDQKVTGVAKLYLVFGGAAKLNWFKFSAGADNPGSGGASGGNGGASGGTGGRTGTAGGGGAGGSASGGAGGAGNPGAGGNAGATAGSGGGSGNTAGSGGSTKPTGGASGSAGGGNTGGSGDGQGGNDSQGSGGKGGNGGASGDGGTTGTTASDNASGCACRVNAAGSAPSSFLPVVALAALAWLGRRRRASRRGRPGNGCRE